MEDDDVEANLGRKHTTDVPGTSGRDLDSTSIYYISRRILMIPVRNPTKLDAYYAPYVLCYRITEST